MLYDKMKQPVDAMPHEQAVDQSKGVEQIPMDRKEKLQYSLGALLYTPASDAQMADRMLARQWPGLTAISLCLEDAIRDSGLDLAERQLRATLLRLRESGADRLPLIFVRVRDPKHLEHVHQLLDGCEDMLTGYILPKFDLTNGEAYLQVMDGIKRRSGRDIYCTPILESRQIASIFTRKESLLRLRALLDQYRDLVLNVRVGGNDFCNLYGARRGVDQTIYDIGVVRDILIDILNVFSDAYVVSGPVWEYYGEDEQAPWATGLKRELALDRVNGFMGKTCIHPSQIPLINRSMRVSRGDYEDAKAILGWQDDLLGVAGSSRGDRMNEVRCHGKWAEMILHRAEAFGIDEEK